MQVSGAREGSAQAFKSDDGKSQNIDTMLDFNALQYEMAPDLSVATDRTFKEHPFQKNEYGSGETAFCILNSGADFIDGRNTYLAFDIRPKFVGTLPSNFATHPRFNPLGSVLQMIRSITITDRAGNEIERVQDVGRLADLLMRNSYSNSWFNTYGRQFGATASHFAGEDIDPAFGGPESAFAAPARWPIDTDTATADQEGTSRGFVIPLRFISGLFDFNQLLPAQLMSGLRFEIQFQQPARALQFPGGDAFTTQYTYTHNNVRIVADSVKLTDSIARELNERAANDGLEIMFRTWFTTCFIQAVDTSQYNVEIRKAVSRAFGALAHFAPIPPGGAEATLDQTQTHPYDFKNWQFRAGNLYFPHQELRERRSLQLDPVNHTSTTLNLVGPNNQTTLGAVETYNHLQRLFGKNHEMFSENDMNYRFYEQTVSSSYNGVVGDNAQGAKEFLRNANPSLASLALLPLDLERSTVQDLSGIPLNNSRILALDFELESPISGEVTIYLQHLKVARVFLDNTEIEE